MFATFATLLVTLSVVVVALALLSSDGVVATAVFVAADFDLLRPSVLLLTFLAASRAAATRLAAADGAIGRENPLRAEALAVAA